MSDLNENNNNNQIHSGPVLLHTAVGKNGLYGLIDHTGSLIVDFKYRQILTSSCGYYIAIIELNNAIKYLVINANGYERWIEKEYSRIYPFREGLALVHKFYGYDKQMYGFIDQHCQEVIPLDYYGAESFNNGLAAVRNNVHKYGFINRKGEVIIPFKYNVVGVFSNGLSRVYIWEAGGRNIKAGFINMSGEEVIPLIFEQAESFNLGLAVVAKRNNEGRLKFGFINLKGEVVIQIKYDRASSFSQIRAAVTFKGESYYIDRMGEKVTPVMKFERLGHFVNGYAIVELGYDEYIKYGLINRQGEIIIEPICKRIVLNYHSDFIYVQKTDGWHLFSRGKGRIISSGYFEIYSFIEGIAIVRNQKKIQTAIEVKIINGQYTFGFIDKDGYELVPCIYEDISEFRDGVGAIKLDGKWNLIEKNRKNIFSDGFDDLFLYNGNHNMYLLSDLTKHSKDFWNLPNGLKYFKNDIGFACRNNKFGIINRNGVVITSFEYDEFKRTERSINNGIIIFKRNDKYGFIRTSGYEICDAIYNDVNDFSEGLAACKLNGKWGFIDESGKEVIPFNYFDVGYFSFGFASIKINTVWGYINKINKVIIKPKFITAREFHYDSNYHELLAYVKMWDGISNYYSGYHVNVKGEIVENVY